MKNISKYILTTMVLCFVLHSCEVTDIDDIKPDFKLNAEVAFSSPEAAETGMTGVYNQALFNSTIIFTSYAFHGRLGLELYTGGTDFNTILPNSNTVQRIYGEAYTIINTINYAIDGVEKLDAADFEGNRKAEMLGELRFLRARQYFALLRSFGQFWDTSSEYGLVLHEKPNLDLNLKPRSSVEDTYKLILDDLDFAIANAPDFTSAIFASKEAAIAYKAKVLLYRGNDFGQVATLANQVTTSSAFEFEANYGDIFDKTFNSSEAILSSYWDLEGNYNFGLKSFFYSFAFIAASEEYGAIMQQDDPRRPFVLGPQRSNGSYPILKYSKPAEATYFLRLPEIYLIEAEALARSGASLTEAQAPLNKVRARLGLPDNDAQNIDELLEDIRVEKLLETAFEDGESWFDMVRYDRLGTTPIETLKPDVNADYKLILPLPQVSLSLSEDLVKQNPGYPN